MIKFVWHILKISQTVIRQVILLKHVKKEHFKAKEENSLAVWWLGLGCFYCMACVQSLVRELKFRKSYSTARKKKGKTNEKIHLEWLRHFILMLNWALCLLAPKANQEIWVEKVYRKYNSIWLEKVCFMWREKNSWQWI